MKRITLDNIKLALEKMQYPWRSIPRSGRARLAVERMLAVKRK